MGEKKMHYPNGRAKEERSEISEPGQIDRFICFLPPSTINCMAAQLLCFCIIHFFFSIISICYTLHALVNSASIPELLSVETWDRVNAAAPSAVIVMRRVCMREICLLTEAARQPPGFWERLSKSLIIERFLRQRVPALWVSFGRALFEFNLAAFALPLHRGTPSCRPAFFMKLAIPFR